MGVYDIAYMLAVPGMTVTAPRDGTELVALLKAGVAHDAGPFCLRYPRDSAPDAVPATDNIPATEYGTWDVAVQGDGLAILAVGTMVAPAVAAAAALAEEGIRVTVVNCRFLKPYDATLLASLLVGHRRILVVEEGTVVNGFGSYIAAAIAQLDTEVVVHTHGVPDAFVEQASRARQLAGVGLDARGIAAKVRALLESEAMAG
jgi:1-deoxy-D-xylulose-5-phosphate synthase